MSTYNVEFVFSALQKTHFYHNAADRELCRAPRKWFMLVFVPLISMCGLSSLVFFPLVFLHLFISVFVRLHYYSRFYFGMGSDVFLSTL